MLDFQSKCEVIIKGWPVPDQHIFIENERPLRRLVRWVGLIAEGWGTDTRGKDLTFRGWNVPNNLALKISKTKELILNFPWNRWAPSPHPTLHINSKQVFQILRVHISADLYSQQLCSTYKSSAAAALPEDAPPRPAIDLLLFHHREDADPCRVSLTDRKRPQRVTNTAQKTVIWPLPTRTSYTSSCLTELKTWRTTLSVSTFSVCCLLRLQSSNCHDKQTQGLLLLTVTGLK